MEKIAYPELFNDFVGRENDLRAITRYDIYKPMYYRSNLFTHSKRVLWLLQSMMPLAKDTFGSTFDATKAELMAVVHDDPEIVMGDIMSGHKNKMSKEQLVALAQQEVESIKKIAERFPLEILGYNYNNLLREEHEQTSLESKLVKYADRLDAFGEALHEIYAGNRAFTTNNIHPELGIIELPTTTYFKWLADFPKNNPQFQTLFRHKHPLFTQPIPFDVDETARKQSPHTSESVHQSSSNFHYDTWKKIILESGDAEEILNLTLKKE